MGQFEFVVLIGESEKYVFQIIRRIAALGDIEFKYSIASPIDHEDSLKFLNRLDESEIRIA